MSRIAIIEDFLAIRELYKYALEPIQAEVAAYPTGTLACLHIPSFAPDLLILDHRLPDMLGYAVLEQVQELSGVPVIVISGYLSPETIAHYHALGVATILEKPIDLTVLLQHVTHLLPSAK